MGRRRRRRRKNGRAWYVTGLMLLLLTGAVIFGGKDSWGRGGGQRGEGSEKPAFGEAEGGSGAGSSKAKSKTKVKDEAKAKGKAKDEAKAKDSAKAKNGTKAKDNAKDEAKDKTGAPSACLESLDGIAPGTVLEPSRLNLKKLSLYFTVDKIGGDILEEINGQSYVENSHIKLKDLRYLKLLHYNYSHEIQAGELIVNKRIAKDCKEVFRELFKKEYEIESMYLVDKFWTGDSVDSDTNSIEHNNTAAFNYRVVPGTDRLSNHAAGFAIDINPLQNPYVKYNSDGSFAKYYKDMEKYTDRNQKKAHMITHGDICYKVFKKHGFSWGGDWVNSKDYQHFEKKVED